MFAIRRILQISEQIRTFR